MQRAYGDATLGDVELLLDPEEASDVLQHDEFMRACAWAEYAPRQRMRWVGLHVVPNVQTLKAARQE